MPRRKASQKSLETVLNEPARRRSTRILLKKSCRMEMLAKEESPPKSLKKPSKRTSHKIKESEVQDIELESQKNWETNSKAVILEPQKNFSDYSKAVVHRQSRQPAICVICKKSFPSKKKLKDHHTKHHFFRHCPNCPKTFQQTRKFILHLRSHIEDHPYECKICLEGFNKKRDLLVHKKDHQNPKRLQCDVCSEVFPHRAAVDRHRLTHYGSPYVCEDCDAVFSHYPDLGVHSKNHVHRCFFCPKEVVTFPSNFDLVNHMYSIHPVKESDLNGNEIDTLEPCVSTGAVNLEDGDSDSMDELPSSDDESDTVVDSNYQIEAVEPVYNLKRKNKFICFICYDLYPSCELLKSHMKGHKWFPCNSCSRFFANAKLLLQHECNFVDVPSFRCKNCNTGSKCENCIKIRNYASEVNTVSTESRCPELPKVPANYCDANERTLLYNFIEHVKSQKGPLDVQSVNHIGLHNMCLEQILEDPRVRCLFPREIIPYIEDLYSKFQDLSQNLCNRLNQS